MRGGGKDLPLKKGGEGVDKVLAMLKGEGGHNRF